jgi:hypothetical protein
MKSEKIVNLVLLLKRTLLITAMIASKGLKNPTSKSVLAHGVGEKKYSKSASIILMLRYK